MRPAIARDQHRCPDPDAAPPPVRLRLLAGMVERLAASGRTDPEQVVTSKFLIAGQLRQLAKELER